MVLEEALLAPWSTQLSVRGTVGSLGIVRVEHGCESGFKVLETMKYTLEFGPLESYQAELLWPKSPLNSQIPHCP